MKYELPNVAVISLVSAAILCACTPERVEYRYRPSYMVDGDAPKEMVLRDGTKVIFVDRPLGETVISKAGPRTAPLPPKLGADGKPIPPKAFEPRERLDDGTVVLRCMMPEHVVANTMACFRNEEYQLMWDQLLAPEARAEWKQSGGFEAFDKWCKDNRRVTMELLNRMRFNAVGSDVSMKQVAPGLTRATLSPHLWDQFKFRVMEFEQTPDGMKLRSIRPSP
jgi:hypothetical protein